MDDILGKNLINNEQLEQIQQRTKKILDNPPNMLCVNVVLNSSSAAKHLICREILMSVVPHLTEQDADWYILCSGAERELLRLTTIGIAEPNNDQI